MPVGQDLQDTLQANRDRCVGMAANMIGVKKKIIIVSIGPVNVVMYNPVILKKDTPYETEEGCLSMEGVRKTTRYQNIEVNRELWQMTELTKGTEDNWFDVAGLSVSDDQQISRAMLHLR